MPSLMRTRWFYFHFFYLNRYLFKSSRNLIRAYKFRKIYPNIFSILCLKSKYLKYLNSKIQFLIMNSTKRAVCNKFSITESTKEVHNVGSLSNCSSIGGLQKKEEKRNRSRRKESICNDLSLINRRSISLVIKSKNSTPSQSNTCALCESNKNNPKTNLTSENKNIFRSNSSVKVNQNIPSTVSIPFYSTVRQAFFNSEFQHRVYRSNVADYSNTTKAVYLDKQRGWSLRRWQRTSLGKLLLKRPENHLSCTFKIMSYNVLAQELLEEHTYLYTHHNPQAITWDQRWYSLMTEIKYHNADILCLQEVQASHLSYFDEFKKLGYAGIYKQRTGIRTDGCAIFYKHSVFDLMEHITVEFNQSDIPVLNRDNVAIIAKFAPKNNTENEFVVSTTHLLYNPRREDVRLAQTQVLFSEVDRISYKYSALKETHHLPIIVTGDFNLTPDSAVYKLIANGFLEYEHLTNRTLSQNTTFTNATGKELLPKLLRITDNCQHADLVEHRRDHNHLNRDEELKLIQLQHSERNSTNKTGKTVFKSLFSTGALSHNFNLKSAYIHNHGNDTEATTFQNRWVTVDYIFYSGDVSEETTKRRDGRLKLLSRFTLPTSQQLEGLRIPNFAFGSDHLSLVVTFRLDP